MITPRSRRGLGEAAMRIGASAGMFLLLASGFFVMIGRAPLDMLSLLVTTSVGDTFAVTESLVRATPILLCALATALPARLGLVSVGAEGQFYFAALAGTAWMLAAPLLPAPALFIGVVCAAMLGGALWSVAPALLRVRLQVNETISTLLLNYVATLLVTWVVYGPWKNAANLGWPSTVDFPADARFSTWFDSRVHTGLWLAIALAVVLHVALTRTRWGLGLEITRSNPRAGALAGLRFDRQALLVMALGGAIAGLAGIAETSSVQGRLQANVSNGAGLSGFLVAWLARNRCLRIIPLALLLGALLAAGDGIQMIAQVPSSVTLVAQGLLFVAVIGVTGVLDRRSR